jgi:hypothetical protein
MIPLFIEVNAFVLRNLSDEKLEINFDQVKKTSIPIDMIASYSEKTFILTDDKKLEVTSITLKTGKEYIVKEIKSEVDSLVEEALPSHLKKESWE